MSGVRTHWLEEWRPEETEFWKRSGVRVARETLTITTGALVLSFATWFMMSAIAVRLPNVGFHFTPMQLFWLTAMPGLAGGTLRIIHMFLIPIYGTRNVVTVSTFLKLIPCVGLALAVMDPATPFWVFMLLAFASGFGGGDFSSYMPSTSLFFPKRLQGSALGIQAGVGNFGVSVAQFATPWIIGFAAFGTLAGAGQVFTQLDSKTHAILAQKTIWLQNAALWYVPLLLAFGIWGGMKLRSVPVKASFREQLDIFGSKHTWFCTITYVMTFGSFSGFSAAFPLLIKSVYGSFPDAPDPLKYAFYGPLVGSIMRVVFGFVSDKTGGAILTQIAGVGLIACAAVMAASGLLTPTSLDQFPHFVGLMLLIFFFTGMGNASTFRQYPIIFSDSPRRGAGVLGWTAAVAAYGPFIFATLIGKSIELHGSAVPFFFGAAGFYCVATAINWWFYTRRGCEKPC